MKDQNLVKFSLFETKLRQSLNTWRKIIPFLTILFLTSFLIAIEKIRLFYGAGWPDPFYYIGYASNFEALQLRDGSTYTATRIPAILIIKIQDSLGLHNQQFRILLIAVSAFLMASFIIRTGRNSAAHSILTSVFVVNNLLFLRHVSDDYSSNFGMLLEFPLFYVCFNLLSGVEPKRKMFYWLGFITSMVMFCNFSSILCVAPIIFFTFRNLQKDKRSVKNHFREMILGFAIGITCIGITSYYFVGLATLENFKALLKSIISIQSSQNGLWTKPLNSVAAYLLLFLVIILFWSGQYKLNLMQNSHKKFVFNISVLKRRNFETNSNRIFGVCNLTFLLGVIFHAIFGGPWLSYSFYAIFYLPLIMYCLCIQLSRSSRLLITCSIIFQILFFRLSPRVNFTKLFGGSTQLRVVTLLFVIGLILTWHLFERLRRLVPVFILIIMLAAPLNQNWVGYSIYSNAPIAGEYLDFAQSWSSQFQENVQNVALKFSQFVKKTIPSHETLWILYPSENSWLTSIASTQLYGYACFHCQDMRQPITNSSQLKDLKAYVKELSLRKNVIVLSPTKLYGKTEIFSDRRDKLILVANTTIADGNLKLFVYRFLSN